MKAYPVERLHCSDVAEGWVLGVVGGASEMTVRPGLSWVSASR